MTASRVDHDLVASVDGQRLRQALANVMKNALEATDRRPGGRVELSLYGRDGTAVVEVCDNGVGMQPGDREKVFLPFFTTKPTGTGLGMAIVKKIIDLHGGEIEIDSAPGRGTTVRLVIPRPHSEGGFCPPSETSPQERIAPAKPALESGSVRHAARGESAGGPSAGVTAA